MVAGAVRTCYARPVKHEGNSGFVKSNIHQHLIKGTIYESRINGNYWVQSAEGHACSCSNSMLLRDTNIKNSVRKFAGEFIQTNRNHHGSGNAHNSRIRLCDLQNLIREDFGPWGLAIAGHRHAGLGINLANRMELVSLIPYGRIVTLALLGNGVDNGWSLVRLSSC